MAVALSDQQQDVIVKAMTRRFGDGVRVWVFGSRVRGNTVHFRTLIAAS
jgi:predicted nucleotidyltransferase